MRGRNKPPDQVRIAKSRIVILFKEAERAAKKKNKKIADRYIQLARKIGMRYNVRIPSELRRLFCRKCKKYLYEGLSSEAKQEKGFMKTKCLNCGKVMSRKLREYKMVEK